MSPTCKSCTFLKILPGNNSTVIPPETQESASLSCDGSVEGRDEGVTEGKEVGKKKINDSPGVEPLEGLSDGLWEICLEGVGDGLREG
mmetsp:Transcript_25070/g.38059  ORF Transcript_25070/g.38059 Transcript_25070/m.38059 type:complete len:88 (-) Transcript_25070:186-449(-)